MLQNAYFLAKIGADTAENEQHFAKNLPKIGKFANYLGPWRELRRRDVFFSGYLHPNTYLLSKFFLIKNYIIIKTKINRTSAKL